MPILSAQQKLRELGRIRLGDRSGTRGAPKRLDTFRFTSAGRQLIDQAAERYGGTVKPWKSPRGDEWEVVSEATELDVIIPPFGYLQQWMEMWSAGGCQRRCDTQTEIITMQPCMCPSDPAERQELAKDGDACSPHSYLWVMLPGIQGLGTWRLVTGSWYAAEELAGVTQLIAEATMRNMQIPASLRIEARSSLRNGKTRRYTVPVIDARIDVGDLARGELPGPTTQVAPPLEGRRGTQRVPLGDQAQLPDNAAGHSEPGHGPAPALPSGEPPEPPWVGATVPDRIQDAWNTWRDWVQACQSVDDLAALEDHFAKHYADDDPTQRNLESPLTVEMQRRREQLGSATNGGGK